MLANPKLEPPAIDRHAYVFCVLELLHDAGIGKASAILVTKQAGIGITADWGGGLVASTDGLRFVVPVRSLHSRPSPLYFGIGKRPRGTTWLNTVSDKVMGLGGLVVPGTMRDSMYILDAIHRLDATEPPDIVTTDTGSYSDVVYGMFAICGYQFAPRHADITDVAEQGRRRDRRPGHSPPKALRFRS